VSYSSHYLLQHLGYSAVSWDVQPPADATVPYVNCDVSSEAKVSAALSETVGKFGAPPAVLVNNCGLQYMAPVTEFPLEKWNTLLGIMVTGTFLCSKAVIPGFYSFAAACRLQSQTLLFEPFLSLCDQE
jgi:NAD(P)-dependent dehydrogenase (short-subunit alcohol dehydrogenase family)